MRHAFDGLADPEKDMNWAGKDGETDESTGAFPAETEAEADDLGMEEDGDETNKFRNMREQLVRHFTWKRKARGGGCVVSRGVGTSSLPVYVAKVPRRMPQDTW